MVAKYKINCGWEVVEANEFGLKISDWFVKIVMKNALNKKHINEIITTAINLNKEIVSMYPSNVSFDKDSNIKYKTIGLKKWPKVEWYKYINWGISPGSFAYFLK